MSELEIHNVNDQQSWFGSSYYKILYGERDEREAQHFVKSLLKHLKLPVGAAVLDAACGTGRHVRAFAEFGYQVSGVDISTSSIEVARLKADQNQRYEVGDIRKSCGKQEFDLVCSFFTSLGFDEHTGQVIQNLSAALKPGGKLMIDFLNMLKIELNLVAEEEKEIEGIHFSIRRFWLDGFLHKHIVCEKEIFEEKVHALHLNDFEAYFRKAGIVLLDTFGSYSLTAFDENTSDRLILLGKRSI